MSERWRLGLLGDPVEHSLSRRMQEAALAACGLEGEYRLLRTPRGTIRERLLELAAEGFRGLNVTVPLKEECFHLLSAQEAGMAKQGETDDDGLRLTRAARRLGAVNTLKYVDGGWLGHNSDIGGFLQALQRCSFSARGRHVVILGAGGAARAVLAAVHGKGASRIEVWNRSPERLDLLLAENRDREDPELQERVVVALDAAMERCPAGAELVIQATSLGLDASDPLPPLPARGERPRVMDLVTHATPWLEACREAGCEASDGREMLLWQGTESFQFWTGLEAPVSAMRAALFGN